MRLRQAFAFIWLMVSITFNQAMPAFAQGHIEWELVNPFRLFQTPQMTHFHSILNRQLRDQEKLNPILSVERQLSQHLPRGWAEEMFEFTCWSRQHSDYIKCGDKSHSYLQPKYHMVKARFEGLSFQELANLSCHWTLKDKTDGAKTLQTHSVQCDQIPHFKIPYPQGAQLHLQTSNGIEVSQDITVKDLFIVGIGDSFASGEGNPDVPVRLSEKRHVIYGGKEKGYFANRGYPTRQGNWQEVGDSAFMQQKALWMSQSCHRSLYSHQLRASLQLALDNPKRAVTFVGFACAGAEITHGLFLRFKGNEWSPAPPKRSQISNVAQAQCGRAQAKERHYSHAFGVDGKLPVLQDLPVLKCDRRKARKIDLLMVSIGGNDVKFSSLVANVVVKDINNLRLIGGWMGHILSASQARQHFGQLQLRYKALNRALHNVLHIPWKQSDRILLTAYPNMSFRDEGRRVCDDGSMGMSVAPLFSLSSYKARRAEKFADQLNDVMRVVAKRYKWTFVEDHRAAFLRHGLCASNEQQTTNLAESLAMPFWEQGRWIPFNPSQYAPYASRKRWFRTPNDAYLTGHLHLSGPVIRNIFKIKGLNRLQVLIAGTYSGAFHPTAEGQAVIADSLAKAAMKVLDKYNQ